MSDYLPLAVSIDTAQPNTVMKHAQASGCRFINGWLSRIDCLDARSTISAKIATNTERGCGGLSRRVLFHGAREKVVDHP